MPEDSFDLKTEIKYYAKVLVIDETGEIGPWLVAELLKQGCFVYCWGSSTDYASFQNQASFQMVYSTQMASLEDLDYLCYFPQEESNCLTVLNQIHSLRAVKILICFSQNSPFKNEYHSWLTRKDLNVRLVVFDVLQETALDFRTLAEKLVNLVFSPETKGGSFAFGPLPHRSQSRPKEAYSTEGLTEEKINFLFAQLEKEKEKEPSPPFRSEDNHKLPPKSFPKAKIFLKLWRAGFLFFFLVLFFFSLPLLTTGLLGVLGLRELSLTKKNFDQGYFSSAIKNSEHANRFLTYSQKTLSATGPFYTLVGLEKPMETLEEVISFSLNINEALRLSLIASNESSNLLKAFLAGESGKWKESIALTKSSLSVAYEKASLAQSDLDQAAAGFKFLRQTETYEKIKTSLPRFRELVLKGEDLLTVLPQILAIDGRKTYLLLFQNNMELRPTGGFIGSFGLVTLERGTLVDFEVYDVYQADGQLRGHVEPPVKLKEYLGEAAWYLRDSNWDPQFSLSAQRAQWFLDKEMQVAVDGTVGITLEVAKKILAAVGEVEMPDYQEKINQENLFQKAEYYVELGTFPGSTQKKDFLGSLSQALVIKVKNSGNKDLVKIGEALFQSLEEKELLFYFNDPQIQAVVTNLGWDGGIKNFHPQSLNSQLISDYLMLNEANVGINKANFFVQRKIGHEVNLKADKVEERLTINYDNQSPAENWPAGRYRTYLRLYLPAEAKVTSVLVADSQNPGLWLPFDSKYFDVSSSFDKNVFGFLVEVPIKSQKTLEIKYELPLISEIDKRQKTYLLMLQKQPGAYPSEYNLTFSYPQDLIPLRVLPSAVMSNGRLLIASRLTHDQIFQIDLAR